MWGAVVYQYCRDLIYLFTEIFSKKLRKGKVELMVR